MVSFDKEALSFSTFVLKSIYNGRWRISLCIHEICVVAEVEVVALVLVERSKETYAAQMLLFAARLGKYPNASQFEVMDLSLEK